MKKILSVLIIVGCCFGLFGMEYGHCDFSNENYEKGTLYFDAMEYLNYFYPHMSMAEKKSISEDVSEFSLNPDMDRNEALANCVEMIITFHNN